MYEQHFRLSGKPFSLLPESRALYFSARHQQVIDLLDYGIETATGFMVITGEVGAGKTSVIRHFLSQVPQTSTVGLITNPSKRLGSMLSWIAAAFDLPAHGRDEAQMYNAFVEFLLAQYARGKRTVLVIDEAQNLAPDVLEELRMLSNVNNEDDQLLQVILSGQPELLETLNRPDLRQFVQRIGVHAHLGALEAADTAQYIRHRLAAVGGASALFDAYACAAVHYFTGGVPRLINLLADQALMYAFAEDHTYVGYGTVAEVATDRNRGGLSAYRASPGTEDALLHALRPLVEAMGGEPGIRLALQEGLPLH